MISRKVFVIFKSPVLHFVVLGLLAFFLYEKFRPIDKETIYITTQTIDALVKQRESIARNPITPELRQQIIEGHIEDEVLLREAKKRGFDNNDYRVRKRLLNIMRSSLTEVIPDPSVAQLRAFYDENRENYKTSPSVSFEHVYFQFSSQELPPDPQEFIRQLEASDAPLEMGEVTLLGNMLTNYSFQMIASSFGKPFAEMVLDLDLNVWHGPLESYLGFHYVRVNGQHDPEIAPFEKMESYLRQDYLMSKMIKSQQTKIDELRKGFVVVVEGKEEKQ